MLCDLNYFNRASSKKPGKHNVKLQNNHLKSREYNDIVLHYSEITKKLTSIIHCGFNPTANM